MAGMGKSTIARTISREYHEHGRLAGSFFFSRGGEDLAISSKLFTTLAVQLADGSPAFRGELCAAISQSSQIGDIGLYEQWERFIVQPLSRIPSESFPGPIIFVVDALDECDGEDDVSIILQRLATCRLLKNIILRIFITSRPETPIQHGIDQLPGTSHEEFVLHNLSPSILERDISRFLKHSFQRIRDKCYLPNSWPGEYAVNELTEKSGGLFIYAATACRFIEQDGQLAEQRLLLLQRSKSGLAPEKTLDEIYTTVLTYSVRGEYNEEEVESLQLLFRQIVGSIVTLFSPLSVSSLAELLGKKEADIRRTLMNLRSVLDTPGPERIDDTIRILHPSFRDFLLDPQRCQNPHFYVNGKLIQSELYKNCLQVMSNHLQRDICHVHRVGASAAEFSNLNVNQYIPLYAQYACRYWVHHWQQNYSDFYDCNGIYKFLRKHLLHWFEALAIIGHISEGVIMVKILDSILGVSAPDP
jgi:hypothetical protein